mgnify:FL=1
MIQVHKRKIEQLDSQGILRFKVSGTTFVQPDIYRLILILHQKKQTPKIILRLEPENKYDSNAVLVLAELRLGTSNPKLFKIGYVPRQDDFNKKVKQLLKVKNCAAWLHDIKIIEEPNNSLDVPITSITIQLDYN